MPLECYRKTTGGKGNRGMFIERDPRVCAAGVPSAQADESVAGVLQQYQLQDAVDALLGDSIRPPLPPPPLSPLRHPIPIDKRHGGPFGDVAQLVNPPMKTKFQQLVEDIKDTTYASFWNKAVGQPRDPTPMLPSGLDAKTTTFGRPKYRSEPLYEVTFPKVPLPDVEPRKRAAYQTCRNYCQPPYSPDVTYGHRTLVDPRGILMKCCLTDNRVVQGTASRTIVNQIQANYQECHQPLIGTVLTPNNNISAVPVGHRFGIIYTRDNIPECLTTCELNPERKSFNKCLAHLNSLRKKLSARRNLLPTFFNNLFLELKYFDTEKSGWLPKNIVYNHCGTKHIRLDPDLIEPLLKMWQAFDGENVNYEKFVQYVLNFKEPIPDLPKVPDVEPKCLDFRTTYGEMTKPGQIYEGGYYTAGLPSGRYLDRDFPVVVEGYCSAEKMCLFDESDMKSCLNPSIMTVMNVSHRDMYQQREPEVVRRVFEAAGDTFTDESFNAVWEKAKKYHSQGWVCYETFHKALNESSEGQKEQA